MVLLVRVLKALLKISRMESSLHSSGAVLEPFLQVRKVRHLLPFCIARATLLMLSGANEMTSIDISALLQLVVTTS
jgi:hypothetical protein